ncbi:MAG: hypothetical protein RSA94_06410, partial [Mucinivorans sp.]
PKTFLEKLRFSEPVLSNSVSFLTALEYFVFLNRFLEISLFLIALLGRATRNYTQQNHKTTNQLTS